jgi:hypothetical protein
MASKALCIGINNYPGTHMDLSGCVNDAQDWAAVLQQRGYAVSALLDAQATKAAMVQAMTSLIGGAAGGDRLVITYSGHGTYQPDQDDDESDGLDEGLCPYDIQTGGGALIDDEIHAIFAARKPGVRLLLIADSCHSGTVTRAAPAEPEADAPRPRFLPMGNWLPEDRLPRTRAGTLAPTVASVAGRSPLLTAFKKRDSDLLLAGCKEGPNNFSYDAKIAGRYNGAFTYYALKTLKTLPAGATYADWHKAIGAYLPSAAYPQSAQIFGSASARRQKVFA